MASEPNGVKILPKISIAWVGRTNVTDRRQTTDRRTDDDIDQQTLQQESVRKECKYSNNTDNETRAV